MSHHIHEDMTSPWLELQFGVLLAPSFRSSATTFSFMFFFPLFDIYFKTGLVFLSVDRNNVTKISARGGEAEPSEGCSYLTRVAPVVIKNDLSLK